MNSPCAVCGSVTWTVAYSGPVRNGKFGQWVEGKVWQCEECKVELFPPLQDNLRAYYAGESYRNDVGESAHTEDFFKLHDDEQLHKYGLLEGIPLRGRVIADIGSAAGSFLDGVGGFARTTIAIEPATSYHHSLTERGHIVFADTQQALAEWHGRVDVAVCFSVIEHIEQPVEFLRDIRKLLVPGGTLLLSTPNRRDILLELAESYRSFFYRTVHIHYFDEQSLRRAVQAAGFTTFEPKHVHRFGFANFVNWLHRNMPTGNASVSPLGRSFDQSWRIALEAQGVADYLYVYAGTEPDGAG